MCPGYIGRLTALSTCLLMLLGNVQMSEEGHTVILLANQDNIRKLNMVTNESTPVVNHQRIVTDVDYIYDADLVFWSDFSMHLIQSVNVTAGFTIGKVITSDVRRPEGIAVDWIYEHIYWTDTGTDTIGVCDLEGTMQKTLLNTRLDEPRGIAVDPIDGWMFWADWGAAAKIERAGMDGCCRESIITRDIVWPNGFSLDYVDKRMFWVDDKFGTLSSANYDGSDRRTILTNQMVIQHTFGLDVFEDSAYWTDWSSKVVHSANKHTGQNLTTLYTGDNSVPVGLIVYHRLRKPEGQNYCKNLSEHCSYFCFATPRITPTSPNVACACPNGKTLAEDGMNCNNQVTKR